MSDVTLTIGGRNYTVACAEGEEAHVTSLGAMLNEKLDQLGGNLSPQESQNLLFAGLFIADDLHEANKQLASSVEARQAMEDEFASTRREANLAIGMRDELQLKIRELESELDGLQSAQQRHDAEVDDMRTELGARRQEALEANEERDASVARIAELERELQATASALDTLTNENTSLKAKVERLGSMSAVVASAGGKSSDEDLAPALERFATLLEECAEKLESAAPAT